MLAFNVLLLAIFTSGCYGYIATEDETEGENEYSLAMMNDVEQEKGFGDDEEVEDYEYDETWPDNMAEKTPAEAQLKSSNNAAGASLMSEVKDLSAKLSELLNEDDEMIEDDDKTIDIDDQDGETGDDDHPEGDLPELPDNVDDDDEDSDLETLELPMYDEPDIETASEVNTMENALEMTAEEMNNIAANSLSLVTRYVGVGYDLIRGSPEGDFSRGGVDPGIKITNHIFRFTYTQNKNVFYMQTPMALPNEVNFHPFTSCAKQVENKVYTGAKSYQKDIATSVTGQGSFFRLFSFSKSGAVRAARTSTENRKRVFMDRKEICNYGQARLLPGRVTTEFYEAVKRLPTTYSEREYLVFISDWGSHIIEEADLGTKKIQRSYASYSDAMRYILNSHSLRLSASFNALFKSGSISVASDYLNQMITSNSAFRSQLKTYTIGSREAPLPISIELRPIYFALQERRYWTDLPSEDTYDSLLISQKMENLKRAFRAYPEKYGSILRDPNVTIPLTWPEGRYAFPEPREGCPVGFARGCRLQDTENRGNRNWFYYSSRLKGRFNKNVIEMCFCVKRTSTRSPFQWPPGRYCIARYGRRCPARFHSGYIFWDDEDDNNKNKAWGTLPDGKTDTNTWRFYCCRSDGDVKNNIILPTKKPFVLYQYLYRGCQQVAGMRVEQVIIHYDDEDKNNDDRCRDGPYNPGCSNNHKIYMCRYRPK